jgi:hypothetical protein
LIQIAAGKTIIEQQGELNGGPKERDRLEN